MKALVVIWVAVVAVALGTGTYVNAAINERVEQSRAEQLQPTVNPQQTKRGTELQMTVSDAYLQWGENPQKTINGKELQGN